MLQKHAVTPAMLELLKSLMRDQQLNQFVLVGGTALALQTAHRKSIDLDLFTKEIFDPPLLNEHLKQNYNFRLVNSARGTLLGFIEEIKVDFLQHLYPDLTKPLVDDSVRMASILDIAAMKLNAIAGNGSRIKDYVDMAYFSSKMTLKEMVQGYEKKYDVEGATALRSLTYFKDIDFKEKVDLIKGDFNWSFVEKRLNEMLAEPNKIFLEA